MKNLRILLSVLLAIAMLLTAASALAEGYSVDVLEVKIWDNNQLAGLQQIADEWTAQSGVKVNIQVVDWDNYWTLLEAGASGGEMPDVFWMHSNNAQMYMGAQKLLDLTDYIAASDKIDLANYYPGITELYSLNDRNYAIAKDHDTIALLYNKAIFDQYGVAYPDETWTWDDYKAAAEAITEASGGEVYGAACNTTNDQDGYFNIIYDFGGYVISEDKKSSGWDNENTIAAMNFVGSLMDKAWAPQQLVAENGTDTLFKNRKVAMSGAFGYELDPRHLTDDERAQVRSQIDRYHRWQELILRGRCYRLSDAQEDFAAWQFVDDDGSRTLVNLVMTHTRANTHGEHIRLRGLRPDGRYRLSEVHLEGRRVVLESAHLDEVAATERVLTGASLMYAGYTLPPLQGDYPSAQLLFERVDPDEGGC